MTRFFERFDSKGALKGSFPRITVEEDLSTFPRRDEGLSILLIHLPIREWSFPNIFPIGEGYVAAVAKMDGHEVKVLDLNAERKGPIESQQDLDTFITRRIAERVGEEKPDIVGFGGIITQYRSIKRAIQSTRTASSESLIVLGGGIGSSMPEFMIKYLDVDIVVQEEGEATFSELLSRVENRQSLSGCTGTVYKDGSRVVNNGLRVSIRKGKEGLDGVPWPLRSLWPMDDVYAVNPVGHLNWESKWMDGKGDGQRKSLSMIGSRGCPYAKSACDYCYASYLGEKYRLRSPSDVAREMYYLGERYSVDYIHFLDDLFLTDWRWVLEFCRELNLQADRTGKIIEWGSTCRTNLVADDVARAKKAGRLNFVEEAYQSGLRHIGFGVESASPTILRSIDKSGQTIEKMRVAIREVQRVLGYADCSFMVGSPGETEQTIRETVEFCRSVDLKPEVFFFTTAYPGTKFWDLAQQKGLIQKSVNGITGFASDDIIDKYLLKLGEQGSHVRTNFSDTPDEEIAELAVWAADQLSAQGRSFGREPHSGDPLVTIKDASSASI